MTKIQPSHGLSPREGKTRRLFVKAIVRLSLTGLIILIVVLASSYFSMDALDGAAVLAERDLATPTPTAPVEVGPRRFVLLAGGSGSLKVTPATQNVSSGTPFDLSV